MTQECQLNEQTIREFQKDYQALVNELSGAIIGQNALINILATSILAGGHILLEGMPGLGKTHLTKSLARALGYDLARIQCTPDLMPSDITGSEILSTNTALSSSADLTFRPGPIFASMVLVDEINRATPKTQSAFLEAMQEHQVSYGGHSYTLPQPFWLIATQNPIEIEGTYPLPEAQIDRFMCKIQVEYPDAAALVGIAKYTLDQEPEEQINMAINPKRVQIMMAQTHEVVIAAPIVEAAIGLILSTQPSNDRNDKTIRRHIHYGCSPRGLQSLLKCARVIALAQGRAQVCTDDIEAIALPVLRHRIRLNMESEMAGIRHVTLLSEIIAEWSARQR